MRSQPDAIHDDVIRRCQQGDLRAYKAVYDHYATHLMRVGMSMLGSKEDAEDAVQMTFLRLYRHIHQFNFQSKFGTYLYRIMVNVCLDIRQKLKHDAVQMIEPPNTGYRPEDDLRLQLQQAIATLPDRMRECFVLFAIDDMKQSDIAEILELSLGTVKAHIFQAKMKLQGLLADSRSGVQS